MRKLLQEHKLGILFSILVGFIYVAPNLFFILSSNYRGIPIIATDAETMYLARMNAVYHGCIFQCNPYIKEYGNRFPHFNPSLSETILSAPGIIAGISVPILKVIYEFVLPGILFLLVYSLVFRLNRRKDLSILTGLYILLGSNILNATDLINFQDIINLFRLSTDTTQFFVFSRPINPQFSSLFFFVYLHVLLSSIIKRNTKWYIFLAITYGFSFYIYFFTYAFITVIQGVLIGLSFVRREWKKGWFFIGSTFAGLILATPVFIQIKNLFAHPYYHTIPTYFLVRTHIPNISIVGIILFLIFIIISYLYIQKYKTYSEQTYFISVLVIACFITRNEHVVSGMIMQYSHFNVYYFTPVFVITVFFLCGELQKKIKWWVFLLLILIPVTNGCLIAYQSYVHWVPYTIKEQKYAPVLQWVQKNTPPGSVIAAANNLAELISIYTPDYVLWSSWADQWIHIPGRLDNLEISTTSVPALFKMGEKYGVNFYIIENNNNFKIYDRTQKGALTPYTIQKNL